MNQCSSLLYSDLCLWNSVSATTVRRMFAHCSLFNGDLSGWDVSNVTDILAMYVQYRVHINDEFSNLVTTKENCLGRQDLVSQHAIILSHNTLTF